jgi:hypothetical protein
MSNEKIIDFESTEIINRFNDASDGLSEQAFSFWLSENKNRTIRVYYGVNVVFDKETRKKGIPAGAVLRTNSSFAGFAAQVKAPFSAINVFVVELPLKMLRARLVDNDASMRETFSYGVSFIAKGKLAPQHISGSIPYELSKSGVKYAGWEDIRNVLNARNNHFELAEVADVTNAPTDAIKLYILAESESTAVRHAVATNPTAPEELLFRMAILEQNPEILITLSKNPRIDEKTLERLTIRSKLENIVGLRQTLREKTSSKTGIAFQNEGEYNQESAEILEIKVRRTISYEGLNSITLSQIAPEIFQAVALSEIALRLIGSDDSVTDLRDGAMHHDDDYLGSEELGDFYAEGRLSPVSELILDGVKDLEEAQDRLKAQEKTTALEEISKYDFGNDFGLHEELTKIEKLKQILEERLDLVCKYERSGATMRYREGANKISEEYYARQLTDQEARRIIEESEEWYVSNDETVEKIEEAVQSLETELIAAAVRRGEKVKAAFIKLLEKNDYENLVNKHFNRANPEKPHFGFKI